MNMNISGEKKIFRKRSVLEECNIDPFIISFEISILL